MLPVVGISCAIVTFTVTIAVVVAPAAVDGDDDAQLVYNSRLLLHQVHLHALSASARPAPASSHAYMSLFAQVLIPGDKSTKEASLPLTVRLLPSSQSIYLPA